MVSTASLRLCLEDGSGSVQWSVIQELFQTVARSQHLSGDLLATLKDHGLKSEATQVVLNSLTVLHTLSLNTNRHVRDQVALSKCMKHLERLLNKPPGPGVEMAAAQLLMDWAFLYGAEDLGHKSFSTLTSTSKHRAMLQSMQPSDLAIVLMEDKKAGMPQFVRMLKGLDFQRQFATQFAAPLSGGSAAPSVLTYLAQSVVATSYSDISSAAAAAAASRNTFAAWAEKVQQNPQKAAQRVLECKAQIEVDLRTLEAAQCSALDAAKQYAQQQNSQGSSNSSSMGPNRARNSDAGYVALRHQLDKAYLAACKCAEWREMVEVLVQQRQLDSTQLSALLALADGVNSTLDEWEATATTELYWLLGVNTAGLADGSALQEALAAAGAAGADTTTAAAASGAPTAAQQQQQRNAALISVDGEKNSASSSYLDLLTGDLLLPSSGSNPFLDGAAAPAAPAPSTNAPLAAALPATVPAASAAVAAAMPAAAGARVLPTVPPEVQGYMQQTQAVHGGASGMATGAYFTTQPPAAGIVEVQQQQQQFPAAGYAIARSTGSTGSGSIKSGSLYPAVPRHDMPLLAQGLRQQHQQTAQPQPGMQHQQRPGSRPLAVQQHITHITASSSLPAQQQHHKLHRTATSEQTGSPQAGPAAVGRASAGDTGSSADSATGYSYINPFASLDTSATFSRQVAKAAGTPSDCSSAAAAANTGSLQSGNSLHRQADQTSTTQPQRQQLPQNSQPVRQQQQSPAVAKKREPPPPPLQATASWFADASAVPAVSTVHTPSCNDPQQPAASASSIPHSGRSLDSSTGHASLDGMNSLSQHSPVLHRTVRHLQDKLQHVLAQCGKGDSGHCQACGLPPLHTLQQQMLALFLQQQQHFEQHVQQLQRQHQQEVAEFKATAVRRFKELVQQQQQQQQGPSIAE